VIVLYMALKHLAEIATRLMAAGRDPGEAVAVVSHATLPQQQVLETTLATCTEDVVRAGIGPPAVIVVGAVVSLRRTLDWLGALAGRRLVADLPQVQRGGEAG
jgi:uroporphyrin-III C-methyltransferase